MPSPSSSFVRCTKIPTLLGTLFLSGCMNPGMYYGNPYGQPMYAPPQMINQGVIGNPGSLIIPESSGPAYNPSGSTYDDSDLGDPTDGFEKADEDGQFYGAPKDDDVAPFPRDRRSIDDLGVQFNSTPNFNSPHDRSRPSSIQPVAATSGLVEYGFDTENYQWLRGVLGFDQSLRQWFITYSPAARDRFGGNLILSASPQQLEEFNEGDMIDVHGHVEVAQQGSDALPSYRVDSIQRISM